MRSPYHRTPRLNGAMVAAIAGLAMILVAEARSQQVVVRTAAGGVIRGELAGGGLCDMRVRGADGRTRTISCDSVREMAHDTAIDGAGSKQQGPASPGPAPRGPEPNATEHLFEVGAHFGLPTVVNLMAGYHRNADGVRVAGMFWGVVYGVELEYLRLLSRPESPTAHRFFIGYGSFNSHTSHWSYLSAGYSLDAYGFHGAVGLAASTGSETNPLLTFQIGYVHAFR